MSEASNMLWHTNINWTVVVSSVSEHSSSLSLLSFSEQISFNSKPGMDNALIIFVVLSLTTAVVLLAISTHTKASSYAFLMFSEVWFLLKRLQHKRMDLRFQSKMKWAVIPTCIHPLIWRLDHISMVKLTLSAMFNWCLMLFLTSVDFSYSNLGDKCFLVGNWYLLSAISIRFLNSSLSTTDSGSRFSAIDFKSASVRRIWRGSGFKYFPFFVTNYGILAW